MPASSKELVRALFAYKPVSRPPFIPNIATAAAQYMQVAVRQMFSNPTTLANSLQSCQRLFKYDGVVILFDTTLEAEACGCQVSWQEGQPPKVAAPLLSRGEEVRALDASGVENRGRIPVVLEAAKRLTQTLGREVAMVGVITGPVTFGKHLMGEAFVSGADTDEQAFENVVDFWGKIALTMARAYGELKLDAVTLADEDLASLGPDHYSRIQPVLKTLRNVLSFYDVRLIVHTKEVPAKSLPALFELEADGFCLANLTSNVTDLSPPSGKLIGGCIPAFAFLGSTEGVESTTLDILHKAVKRHLFITSAWEVPQTTPALNLHKVMQVLTGASDE